MGKVLITGGAGFIGSHLAERLIAEHAEVYVIDDLSTGSISNLSSIINHPKLHVHISGIEDRVLLNDLTERVDIVFHMAAAVGVKLIVEEPIATIKTNISGTENVLESAEAAGGKKVVLASTSEVYGKGSETKFHEEDDLIFGPTACARWSYGCSKAIDEFLALAYHRSRGLPVIIARLFNTVGPRQTGSYGMVVPRFVRQAINGEAISVYGDGGQVRCFTHVSDVIDMLLSLADCEDASGEIFNVGNDEPVSIGELAERVRDMVNPEVRIDHLPYEEAYGPGFEDIRVRRPDIGKLNGILGKRINIGLDGIIKVVRDYMESTGSI